jgi:hypothetical protein
VNETAILPAPAIYACGLAQSKWEREHAAFCRLLPELLGTQRGKFVAIHDERVVDSGDDKLSLALRVLAKIGNTDIFVGFVTDEPPSIARSGIRRKVRSIEQGVFEGGGDEEVIQRIGEP